ncbi:MAG: hypothetical protein ABSA65_18975 [Acidimicrobiales bacterium]|jgi:hypothetical protein
MPSDELSFPLTEGVFREQRVYLGPEAFGDPGDGIESPTDLINQREWMHLMDSPTDVVLQTTDHFGSAFLAIASLCHMWICAIVPPDEPEPSGLPLVFDAYLDAYDEFEAAPFIAAHGWYRQGTAGLRNALEVMTNAAHFAIRGDRAGHAAWRDGTAEPPKFGNSVDLLGSAPSVAAIESTLPGSALFGVKPDGVARALYEEVCRFTHGRPGHTNADIWEGSNGPIFIPNAFTQFWRDFRDTALMCFVLLKIAHPAVDMPRDLPKVAENAGSLWHGLAPATVVAYFP